MNEYIIYAVMLFIIFITFIIMAKYKKNKNSILLICLILMIVIFISINIYQNLFLYFNNISSALNYSYPYKTIKYKTQYDDYFFVVYEDRNKVGLTYFINENDKFKYHRKSLFDFDIINYKNFNILKKYIKEYDVCYVYIDYIDVINKEIEITNIPKPYLDSQFENIYGDYYQYSYSFIIENYSKNSYIYLNGEKVKI